jgi:hypothetical protein
MNGQVFIEKKWLSKAVLQTFHEKSLVAISAFAKIRKDSYDGKKN